KMENISGVDGDQLWLLNCLNATFDINQDIRSSAEDSLKQASAHPGNIPKGTTTQGCVK
ncbi:hypothetical protein KI387_023274, partial [Taxus chinensis]